MDILPERGIVYYTTLGEADFWNNILIPIIGTGISLGALLLGQREISVVKQNVMVLSVIAIIAGTIIFVYLVRDAGKYTVDKVFYEWQGMLLTAVSHLLISIFVIVSVYITLAFGTTSSVPIPPENFQILLGLAVAMTWSAKIAGNVRADLKQDYQNVSEIKSGFEEETEQSVENLENEIEGQHIERSETSRIVNAVRSFENAALIGDGGVGKSGILKKVLDTIDRAVLFIDASRSPRIQDVSVLSKRLGISKETDLERAIKQVSFKQPLLVIIDELDRIGAEEGQVLCDFIMMIARMENVSVVFACREHDLQTRSEYKRLRESDEFQQIPVERLNRAKTAEYIEDLIGSSPPEKLIDVGRNIQYLDAIADLADEVDLEEVSGKAALWEKYRESLEDETQPGDDDRKGEVVVERAVEHAKEATEDGTGTFTVPVAKEWGDKQLINRGTIVAPPSERGERQYRFRHPDFQTYLYAWDAVQKGETINEVTDRLDDRLGKDVFRWMSVLYRQSIEEILDEDEGPGYYATTIVLDEIKTWDATANPDLADIVLDKLGSRDELYRYFLDDETDPSWAYKLQERGDFEEPSNILIGFLGDIAPEHPETVGEVLDSITVTDSGSQALLISAIRELPATEAAEHVELVTSSLTQIERNDQRGFEAVQLMEELIKREHVGAGLDILDALLVPQKFGEQEHEAQPKVELYNLNSTLEEVSETIINQSPVRYIEILRSHLETAVEIEADLKDQDPEIIAGFHLSPVSDINFEDRGYGNLREFLTEKLRRAIELWLDDASDEKRRETVDEYLRHDFVLFRRLGLHFLNRYHESCPDILRRELQDESNYGESLTKNDFLELLGDCFGALPEDDQGEIIELILSVPVRDSLEEDTEKRSDELDDASVDELQERVVDKWIRRRLWIIRDHLSGEADEKLSELLEEYGKPQDAMSDFSVKSGSISEESPKPDEELREMSPDELLEFLSDWEPDEDTTRWEETDWGGLREENQRGLAEAAARVILSNPSRYEDQIPEFRNLDSVYTTTLLNQLREELEDNPETFTMDYKWSPLPVFELCKHVATDPDNWDTSARISVARLLKAAFSTDAADYILEYPNDTKDILFELLDDPDPSLSRDRQPEGQLGHNNPLHVALNSVRPIALEGLIIYSIKAAEKRNYEGYSEEQESGFESDVREQMVSMLDDYALAVRSIFGRRLPQIWYLDHPLVLDNREKLFPRNQSSRDKKRFSAAWDAYVSSNILHEDIFPELRSCYFHGIDLHTADETTAPDNAQEGLAYHIVSAYLFDFEDLDRSDSLVTYLYDRDDPELSRQIAWRLWRSGKDNEEIRQKWDKVTELWEMRLKQVDDVETYTEEIQWFIEWLPLVEEQIDLEDVEELIRESLPFIAHNRRSWETVESFLENYATEYPEKVVDIYAQLMEQGTIPTWIRFTEETASVLRPGLGTENKEMALDIAEKFAENGDEEAKEFLDENT